MTRRQLGTLQERWRDCAGKTHLLARYSANQDEDVEDPL
jgi:hypothetical protein